MMSGPASINDVLYFEFDICYISKFYYNGVKYDSIIDFIEANNELDTASCLTLKALIAKLDDDVNLLNKLIETKDEIISYPYNNSDVNYALILKGIRAYYKGNTDTYNNILRELGC